MHHYLLGTLNRKLVAPIPPEEIAAAVSALAGIELSPSDVAMSAAEKH